MDPSVREDGDSEPELQLVDPETGPKAATEPERDTSDGESAPPPHPSLPPGESAAPEGALDVVSPDATPSSPNTDPKAAPVNAEDSSAGAVNASITSGNETGPGLPITSTSQGAMPSTLPGTGHPVRDKLLERARVAKAETPPLAAPAPSPGAPTSRRGLAEFEELAEPRTVRDTELESVGTPRVRLHTVGSFGPTRGQLSPTMVAVFGALIGLATVASLIALAMNFDSEAGTSEKPASSAEAVGAAAKPEPPVGAVPERKRQKMPGPWRITDAKSDPTTRVVEGKIGRKAFLVALADAGVAQKEAYRLLIAYKGVRDLDKCDKDDSFRALVERGTGRLKAFEYVVSPEEVYQAREDKNGYLKAAKLDLKVGREQIMGAFMFDGESVDSSAKPAGFDKGLREVLAKALDGHMDLGELERGDRLRVIAQEVTVLGEFARYAGIEAIEVLPRDPANKPLRVYYFHHATAGGYYNERGQAPYEGGWRKPVKDAPVTSKFNPNRLHPVLKKVMPHTGTDFGAPTGTPVGASSYGTVSFIGPAGPSGNLVKIEHPGGVETGYAHLSRFAEGLKVGDKVKRLQLVGYVGSTGRSTGPHLHFTAKRDGKFFDAETLKLDALRVIEADYRADFEKVKQNYEKLLNTIPVPPPVKEPPRAEIASATPANGHKPDSTDSDEVSEASESDESGADTDLGSHDEGDTGAVAAAPVAATPVGAPAKPSPKGSTAVYLTDKELLEMQSQSDDGEVEE